MLHFASIVTFCGVNVWVGQVNIKEELNSECMLNFSTWSSVLHLRQPLHHDLSAFCRVILGGKCAQAGIEPLHLTYETFGNSNRWLFLKVFRWTTRIRQMHKSRSLPCWFSRSSCIVLHISLDGWESKMIKMIISSFSVKQMEVLRSSRLSVIWDILISKAIGLLYLRTFNKNCFECESVRKFSCKCNTWIEELSFWRES